MVKEKDFEEIKNRIIRDIDPERIIIFGSYASGNATETSDVDILVVKDSSLPSYKRSIPVYKSLSGIMIPKDVVVYSQKEIDDWSEVPQAFITTIVKNGKVIYEKE